jgi:alpha-tubulin suppressor-like RCC1 family protein
VFENSDVTVISAGSFHTCAIKEGSLYCWGTNLNGRLGDGTTTDSNVPVKVSASDGFTNSGVTAITADWEHTCAIEESTAYCWGSNFGRLGNGAVSQSLLPAKVSVANGFSNDVATAISAGISHTCAINDGQAFCWGGNVLGQLGDATTQPSYVPVKVSFTAQSDVAAVAAGQNHSCAIQQGKVFCWGANDSFQLAQVGVASSTPVEVVLP